MLSPTDLQQGTAPMDDCIISTSYTAAPTTSTSPPLPSSQSPSHVQLPPQLHSHPSTSSQPSTSTLSPFIKLTNNRPVLDCPGLLTANSDLDLVILNLDILQKTFPSFNFFQFLYHIQAIPLYSTFSHSLDSSKLQFRTSTADKLLYHIENFFFRYLLIQ